MPSLSDYADLRATWRQQIGLLPRAPLRDPSLEEFFRVCEAMAQFDEAQMAYTLPAGQTHLSDENMWVRIHIFHSVLAKHYTDLNERSAYFVPKGNILIDHFNGEKRPVRDPINLQRVQGEFDHIRSSQAKNRKR